MASPFDSLPDAPEAQPAGGDLSQFIADPNIGRMTMLTPEPTRSGGTKSPFENAAGVEDAEPKQTKEERDTQLAAGEAIRGAPFLGPLVPKAEAWLQTQLGTGPYGSYEQNLAERERLYKQFEEEHPYVSTGMKIGGGAAALGGLGWTSLGGKLLGMTGSLPRMAGMGALSSAAISGGEALEEGKSPEEAAAAAKAGLLPGAAGPVAGRLVGGAARAVLHGFRPPQQIPTDVGDVAPKNIDTLFGQPVVRMSYEIPGATPAQKAANKSAAQQTEAALNGSLGKDAQEAAIQAHSLQAKTVDNAADAALDKMNPNAAGPRAENSVDAAGQIADSIRAKYADAGNDIDNAFDLANQHKGQFVPGLMNKQNLDMVLDNNLNGTQRTTLRTPSELAPAAKLAYQHAVDTFNQAATRGFTSDDVSSLLKNMTRFYGMAKSPEERGIIGGITHSINDLMDVAGNVGGWQGDQGFLGALRNARGLYAQREQMFGPKSANNIGKTISDVLDNKLSDDQFAQQLYGGSGKNVMNPKGKQIELANWIKDTFNQGGQVSHEHGLLQQGAFKGLLGSERTGAQTVANNFRSFLDNKADYANALYGHDPEMLPEMQRFAGFLKDHAPKRGTVNTSFTAPFLEKLEEPARERMTSIIGGMLGFHAGHTLGGIPGAIIGAGLSHVGNKLLEAYGHNRAAAKVFRNTFGTPYLKEPEQLGAQIGLSAAHALAPSSIKQQQEEERTAQLRRQVQRQQSERSKQIAATF